MSVVDCAIRTPYNYRITRIYEIMQADSLWDVLDVLLFLCCEFLEERVCKREDEE